MDFFNDEPIDKNPDGSPIYGDGFAGSGTVMIQGLPKLTATFAFMRVSLDGKSDWKRARFLYLEVEEMSIQIPVVEIFIREIGLGFGYRYTLAAIKASDDINDVRQLLKTLKKLALTQGNLSRRDQWRVDLKFPLAGVLPGAQSAVGAQVAQAQLVPAAAGAMSRRPLATVLRVPRLSGPDSMQPVSIAVSPYLGLWLLPTALATRSAQPVLVVSELVCFDVNRQDLISIGSKVWNPTAITGSLNAYIQAWRRESQARMAADSPIAVIRIREIHADPTPPVNNAPVAVSVVYRFLAPDQLVPLPAPGRGPRTGSRQTASATKSVRAMKERDIVASGIPGKAPAPSTAGPLARPRITPLNRYPACSNQSSSAANACRILLTSWARRKLATALMRSSSSRYFCNLIDGSPARRSRPHVVLLTGTAPTAAQPRPEPTRRPGVPLRAAPIWQVGGLGEREEGVLRQVQLA